MAQYSRNELLYIASASAAFLMSPLLALPYIFYGIYRRYNGALLLLSLFFGIWAYLWPPLHDLYRHYHYYCQLVGKPLSWITFERFQMNGAVGYVYCLLANIGVPFEYARLIMTTIAMMLLASIWKYKIEETGINYSNGAYVERFFVFLLFFDLYYTVGGVKYGFALAIYLYSVHCWLDLEEKKRAFWLFLLSGCFHTSMFLFGTAAFILAKTKIDRITSIFLIFLTVIAFNIFFTLYGDALLGSRMDWYLSENSGVAKYSHMTNAGSIIFWGSKMCALPFVWLIYKRYCDESKWCKFALAWFVMSLAFFNNAVFFYRIWWGFMAMGVYVLLDFERLKNVTSYYLFKTIVAAGLAFCIINTVNYRSFVLNARNQNLLTPVPYILTTSYSKADVQNHVKSSGGYRQ